MPFTILRSILFTIIAVGLFLGFKTQAATIRVLAPQDAIGVGKEIKLDIFIDTEGEVINAVEGVVFSNNDLFEFISIRDGDSIVLFWVEQPALKTSEKNAVSFSGIRPGGYIGDSGLLFSLIVRAVQSGQGGFDVSDAHVLLNDGLGTEVEVKIQDFVISVSEQKVSPDDTFVDIEDTDPPEIFTPHISRDPNIYDGQWFLVFATQDKGWGMDRFEVFEYDSKNQNEDILEILKESNVEWQRAQSPYLLKNQNLRSQIFVKAIDRAGNEWIAMIGAQGKKSLFNDYRIYGIILTIFIILLIAIFVLLRHSKNKKTLTDDIDEINNNKNKRP